MKKRVTAAILSVSMAATMCACGGGSAKEQGGTAQSQSGSGSQRTASGEPYVPTYPIVEEPITVTGLVVGCDTSVSDSRAVWDLAEEVTGIHIEWVNIDEAALSTYLAGSDWPDFFHTYELTTSQINDYGVVGGRFVNYLDYLDIVSTSINQKSLYLCGFLAFLKIFYPIKYPVFIYLKPLVTGVRRGFLWWYSMP